MAYEQKELSGSLFKNEKREKDTHPNLQGSALIDGVEYWVSGWTKERDNGDKWISLAFKPKEQRRPAPNIGRQQQRPEQPQRPQQRGKPQPGGFDQMGDDIPFAPIGKGISGHAL